MEYTEQDDAVRAMVRRNRQTLRRVNRLRSTILGCAGVAAVAGIATVAGWERAIEACAMGWATAGLLYYGFFAWRGKR